MIRVFVIACGMLASSHALAATVLDGSYPSDAPKPLSVVEKAVTSNFVDPRSAQFKHLSLVRNTNGNEYLCGVVNAKNGLGGYTPFYPFFYNYTSSDAYIGQDYRDEIVGPIVSSTFEAAGCSSERLGIQLISH